MLSIVKGESKGQDPEDRSIDSRVLDLAVKHFPELKELRDLYGKIIDIEGRRMELLLEEGPVVEEYSDEMEHEVELTEILIGNISRFQHRRISDAEKIKAFIRDALATIDDIEEGSRLAKAEIEAAMIRNGVMLPPISKAMDWERDTNVGDTEKMDEDLVQIVNFMQGEIKELRDRLNYHAVLHGLVQKWKLDFAINAELRGQELSTFLYASEQDQEMRLSRLVLPKAREIMNEYLWKTIELEHSGKAVGLGISPGQKEKEKEENSSLFDDDEGRNSIESWDTDEINDIFHGTDTPSSSEKQNSNSDPDELVCRYCKKAGHHDSYCQELYPEMRPKCRHCNRVGHPPSKCWKCDRCNRYGHRDEKCQKCSICHKYGHNKDHCRICSHCKRDSHTEEKCWDLNPGLKAEYLTVKGIRN